jgi:thiol-disulfide isomerase/thioredoxin
MRGMQPNAPHANQTDPPARRWCPHCRAFKPTYEKVADFCGRHTGITVFRIDCATEVGCGGRCIMHTMPCLQYGMCSARQLTHPLGLYPQPLHPTVATASKKPASKPPAPPPPQPDLCNTFQIRGYPTLLAGNASDVVAQNASALQDMAKSKFEAGRSAGQVVRWLGSIFGR